MGRFARHITADSLREDDVITFTQDGEWIEQDFSKTQDGSKVKMAFKCWAKVNNGDPKEFIVNATSGKALDGAWGDNSWVGRRARVKFVKMICFGEETDVLLLEPMKDANT